MIIVSDKIRNQIVKFGKEKVKFNNQGKAEVSDEFGKKLIFDHEGYYEEGKKQVKVVESKVSDEITDVQTIAKIKELESQKAILEQRLEKAVNDLNLSKEETENWKAEYTKAKEGVLETLELTATDLNIPKLQENDINVVIDLVGKTKKELIELCEGLGLLKTEWEALKANELVVYLAKKTLYAEK